MEYAAGPLTNKAVLQHVCVTSDKTQQASVEVSEETSSRAICEALRILELCHHRRPERTPLASSTRITAGLQCTQQGAARYDRCTYGAYSIMGQG
eukprot:3631648-Pleurochrysis_carterae.AAC.1